LNAITSDTSVLLPLPLEPTSAVVLPPAPRTPRPAAPAAPRRYSNQTSSNATSPRMSASGWRRASASSSVGSFMTSRMRSSPAIASEICVPMLAMLTTGAASMPTKNTYISRSPSVRRPSQHRRAAHGDDQHADEPDDDRAGRRGERHAGDRAGDVAEEPVHPLGEHHLLAPLGAVRLDDADAA
jgi:hypothetical protein